MWARHSLAYLPAQLLGPVLQLAAAIGLTHVQGAAEHGLTMLVFASQELVFLLCLSWWTMYVLRYGHRTLAGTRPAAQRGAEVAIVGVSSLAQVLLTLGVVAATGPGRSPAFWAAACAFTVTRSLLGLLSERARRDTAIGQYTLVQVAAPAGGVALSAAAAAAHGQVPAEDVLAAFALAQALVGAVVAWRQGLVVRPRAPPPALLRAAARFGLPVVLSNLLSWLGGNGIRWVVHHGAGAAALGLMSVGWGLATRLAGVVAMLVSAAAYPLAVRAMEAGDSAGARRHLAHNAVLLVVLLVPSTLIMAALVQPLSQWLVAPAYQATTVAILPWALLGAAVRNLRLHGWDPIYLLHEAPRAMVVLDAVEAALTVLAAALGLWLGGVSGAVIGTSLAAVVVALGDALYLRRRFGLDLPLGLVTRVLAAAAGVQALLTVVQQFGWRAEASATGLALAALALLLAYLLLLAVLLPAQARWLWGQLRRRPARGLLRRGGPA